MRRFLVPPDSIAGNRVPLAGDLYRHMVSVLRLQPGDNVILCNGEGTDFHATIRENDDHTLYLQITERHVTTAAATPSLTLIQGLPKGDKFDLIIQKATELGVNSIVAFPAAHSVARIAAEQAAGRLARWGKIAAEASRQSERNTIPTVTLAKNLDTALRDVQESVKILLWERENANTLKGMLMGSDAPEKVALLAGPEGGFSPDEVAVAMSNGFMPVSLGPRILRTETAGLAAIAILQYHWGDMG